MKVKNRTFIILQACIFLCLLGCSIWQFYRLNYKLNIISNIEQKRSLPAVDWRFVDWANVDYSLLNLQGSYLPGQEIYFYSSRNGKQGFEIITPFQNLDGKIFLVKRGWIEKKHHVYTPEGVVSILVYVNPFPKKPLFSINNDLKNNVWFYLDWQKINQKIPIEKKYLTLVEEQGKKIMDSTQYLPKVTNYHLGYALMWLFFSLISLYFSVRVYKSRNV